MLVDNEESVEKVHRGVDVCGNDSGMFYTTGTYQIPQSAGRLTGSVHSAPGTVMDGLRRDPSRKTPLSDRAL